MKKLALTVLISALICSPWISAKAQAQDSTKKSDDSGFHFGLKLTPTFSWFVLDREGYDSDGMYIGYTYGLMTDFRLAKNYYFATGVEISQRGGKIKSDELVTENGIGGPIKIGGEVTQRLQFVDIPFSLKLKTNEIGYMQYYGQFGFLAGFMVKANQDVDFDDNSFGYTDKTKRNNQSDFGFFNFGLNVGLGLEYNIAGNTDITVGLGYHNAFVDIWKAKDAKLTSNYLTLNFGVFF